MIKGFTIVELVLSIAILGILSLAIGPGLSNAIQSYNLIGTRRMGAAEARAAMERMVREIRVIPRRKEVIQITASSFQFQYPVGTTITYSLSGTNLLRNSDVLLSQVTSLSFTGYDETGVATTIAGDIRSVQVSFTTSLPITLRTRVFLVNTGNLYRGFNSL
jgi:prepilin-type N-terminal cleavage/methylation domain-containing protein